MIRIEQGSDLSVLMRSAVWVHDRLEMFEEWGSVRGPGVQFPVDTQFDDILHYHPHDVICPDPPDEVPGQSRHTPAEGAHENRANLRANNGPAKLGGRKGQLPKRYQRPRDE